MWLLIQHQWVPMLLYQMARVILESLIPTLAGAGVVLRELVDYGTGAVYDFQPNQLHVALVFNRN